MIYNLTGNNSFLVDGIIFTGAHCYQLLLSIVLISITWLAFFFGILPFIHEAIPYQILLVLILGCYATFFLTACMDPGIYPRRQVFPLAPDATQHPLHLQPTINMKQFLREQDLFHQFYYHYYQNWREEYCELCGILHTKRTRHCRYCNNCVHTFDHHCPVSRYYFILHHLITLHLFFFL